MKLLLPISLACSMALAVQPAAGQSSNYSEVVAIRYEASAIRLSGSVVAQLVPDGKFVFKDVEFEIGIHSDSTPQPAGVLLVQVDIKPVGKEAMDAPHLKDCAKSVRQHLAEQLHRRIDIPQRNRLRVRIAELTSDCDRLDKENEKLRLTHGMDGHSEPAAAMNERQRLFVAQATAQLEIETQAPMVKYLAKRLEKANKEMELMAQQADSMQSDIDNLKVKLVVLGGSEMQRGISRLMTKRRRILRESHRRGKGLDTLAEQLEQSAVALQRARFQAIALEAQIKVYEKRMDKILGARLDRLRVDSMLLRHSSEIEAKREQIRLDQVRLSSRQQVEVVPW